MCQSQRLIDVVLDLKPDMANGVVQRELDFRFGRQRFNFSPF